MQVSIIRIEALRILAGFQQEAPLKKLRQIASSKRSILKISLSRALGTFVRDYITRIQAIRALASLMKEEDLPMLRSLAKHEDPSMRLEAVQALAAFMHLQDLPLLRDLAKYDKSINVRDKAVQVLLLFLQDQDLPMLRDLVKNGNSSECIAIIKNIGKRTSPAYKSVLLEMALCQEDDISHEAVMSLAHSFSQEEMENILNENDHLLSVGALAAFDTILYMPDWLKSGLTPHWK